MRFFLRSDISFNQRMNYLYINLTLFLFDVSVNQQLYLQVHILAGCLLDSPKQDVSFLKKLTV